MARAIVINLVYLGLILPFVLMVVNKNCIQWKRNIILFSLFFLLYKIVLLLPIYITWMQIDGLTWNWVGKLLAILFSLAFYHKFKQNLGQEIYLKVKQQKQYFKLSIIIFLIVLGLSIIEGVLFYNQKLNIETLLFQLTLPGIDEEIAYRGIILGLFSSFMVNKISLWKITIHHPSIWIVGTLFGLIHALQFNQEWELTFDLLYFIKTFLLGTIWSYMTIKTKSILFPVLSHNLSNTLTNLIGMMK